MVVARGLVFIGVNIIYTMPMNAIAVSKGMSFLSCSAYAWPTGAVLYRLIKSKIVSDCIAD